MTREQADVPFTVTLALEPEDVGLLLLAREQGQIQLSLRSRGEQAADVQVPPANLLRLLESVPGLEAASEGADAKASEKKVEIFRGLEREVVVLPGRSE